jgi:hypothetical protein
MSLYSHCNPDQFSYSPTDYSVQDGGDEHPVCDECGELLGGLDREGDGVTCWNCLHPDCEDYPCQDCYETAIDRAHDSMDTER